MGTIAHNNVVEKDGLLMPEWLALPEDIPDCCGPGSGIGNWLVPDRIYGLRVSAACFIHDAMYSAGEFETANNIFRENLRRIIWRAKSGRILRRLRLIRAYTYYLAVSSKYARRFVKGYTLDHG